MANDSCGLALSVWRPPAHDVRGAIATIGRRFRRDAQDGGMMREWLGACMADDDFQEQLAAWYQS